MDSLAFSYEFYFHSLNLLNLIFNFGQKQPLQFHYILVIIHHYRLCYLIFHNQVLSLSIVIHYQNRSKNPFYSVTIMAIINYLIIIIVIIIILFDLVSNMIFHSYFSFIDLPLEYLILARLLTFSN